MFEAQPLKRVCKFDIDAEIVGIELEFVAFEQRPFSSTSMRSVAISPSTASFQ